MSQIRIVVVKRSPEESARNGVFLERNPIQTQANPLSYPDGEVWIADDKEYVVALTDSIQKAIADKRLVMVSDLATLDLTAAAPDVAEPGETKGEVTVVETKKAPRRAKAK